MGLGKFLKKAKKAVKKVAKGALKLQGAVNPLLPGGKANKLLTAVEKKALPFIAGAAGVSALGGILGDKGSALATKKGLGGILADVGDFANTIGGYAGQVGAVLDVFSPDHPASGPGAPSGGDAGDAAPGFSPDIAAAHHEAGGMSTTTTYVLIGAAALVAVLALRKG